MRAGGAVVNVKVRSLGWIAVLVVALALRLVGWERVDPTEPATNPFDGDCQYHRLRAEQIASRQPQFYWKDPQLGDGGVDIPWPPLFDEVIASAATLASAGSATPEGVARAAAWTPVVLGVATVPLVGWLAGILVGPELALGAALLLALSAPHAFYSTLGRSDQHVLELLLTVTILVAYARGLAARNIAAWWTAALALGIAIALAFWNWQGSALNLIFLSAFVSVWHVLTPRDVTRGSRPAAVLVGGCGVGTVVLVGTILSFAPAGALARGTISGITGLHVLLTAGTGLFAMALWGARRMKPVAAPGRRLGEVLAAAAATLGAAALVPAVRDGISHGLLALLNGNRWYASIAEFQPMLFGGNQPVSQELIVALAQYALAPVLAVAGAAGLRDRWRKGDERTRPAVLLLAIWGAMAFALTLARNRFGLYAAPPLAIWCWVGIRHAQARWVPGLSRGALGSAFAATAIAAAVAGPLIQYVRNVRAPAAVSAGPLLAWTRERPDPTGAPTVYARWGWGHHVRALARRPAVANPFGTEGGARGFEESLRVFLSTEEAEVERVLRERRAGYLLAEDPRADVMSYQDVLPPGERVAEVSSSWRTGRTLVENDRYRTLVAYRLHFHDGSSAEGFPALGGFRLLRETVPADPDKSVRPAFGLFGFVPGARLAVTGVSPWEEITATTKVRANTGREFTWRTTARAGASGDTVLRVPYATGENGSSVAGPFEVTAGAVKRIVAVPEDRVVSGQTIAVAFPAPAAESRVTALRDRAPR